MKKILSSVASISSVMTSPSKNKGNSFEREVAKFLTEHYGETFIRAPGSGAYVGGKNQQRRQYLHEGQVRSFKGDIVPGESFTGFNAECKSYRDFGFHQLFTGNAQLEGWLAQLMAVADPCDCNVLFMKFNRRGSYVVVQAVHPWHRSTNYCVYRSAQYGEWMIYDFHDFFKLNSNLFKSLSGSSSIGTRDVISSGTVVQAHAQA